MGHWDCDEMFHTVIQNERLANQITSLVTGSTFTATLQADPDTDKPR